MIKFKEVETNLKKFENSYCLIENKFQIKIHVNLKLTKVLDKHLDEKTSYNFIAYLIM